MDGVKRWGTALFALAAMVSFAASVLADPIQAAAPGEDTYVLSEFRITYPFADSIVPGAATRSDQAGVAYTARWSGQTYPGEAKCEIQLFAADGSTVGVVRFSNDSGAAPFTPGPMPVPVAGRPATATGLCAAGVKPDATASYSFTDVALVRADMDLVVEGDELVLHAIAHWADGVRPGMHQCSTVLAFPDGTSQSFTFGIDVGEGDAIDVSLPEAFADVALGPASRISCAPYVPHAER